jgi:hypothetical protein
MTDKSMSCAPRLIRSSLRYISPEWLILQLSINVNQMADHLKTSDVELNTLLSVYWKLRHETGKQCQSPLEMYPNDCMQRRRIHRDAGQ